MSIESCSECGKNVEQCLCRLEDDFQGLCVLNSKGEYEPVVHRKPPLGVMPHFLWLEKRITHIQEAIDRYDEAGMQPKPEWIEQQKSLLAVTTLYETNRRLNRRCQDAESALNDLRNELEWKLDRLFMESNRAWRYAGELRDIYRNHRAKFMGYGCLWCKLKWRVNRWLWKKWSME